MYPTEHSKIHSINGSHKSGNPNPRSSKQRIKITNTDFLSNVYSNPGFAVAFQRFYVHPPHPQTTQPEVVAYIKYKCSSALGSGNKSCFLYPQQHAK